MIDITWNVQEKKYYCYRFFAMNSSYILSIDISIDIDIYTIIVAVGRGREPWERSEAGGVIGNE